MGKAVRVLVLVLTFMLAIVAGCCYVDYDENQDTMRYKPESECDYFFIDLGPAARPESPVDRK